jgi:3-hydroxybutyryl-CoA dehydrogenase
VKDSPGFASSRLGVLLGLEAIRMLEEGVADAEAIDTAMELGYRHPMGPLRSTDLVGLDVRLAIAEYLHRTLGERFAPPQLLRDKVAAGELGRKTGRGFHTYESLEDPSRWTPQPSSTRPPTRTGRRSTCCAGRGPRHR